MIVLKANNEQYNALNGFQNGNSILQFVKDADDNWIVGKSVLTDDAFLDIRADLEALEEIDFSPILEDI